ncbi:stage 0 sporulation family protein [bacterium]|nr:stage 0 sporulation family protein [bacterium]
MAKILEIEFKGGRKAFYANPHEFPFRVSDRVIVEVEKGEGMGTVINLGSLVDKRAGDQTLPQILRKPEKSDFDYQLENDDLEKEAFTDCKERIEGHTLDMKLVDVEYQFDRKKITFYFTSENRVDFRALVRDLASRYRTRIELRQIGVRDEAKRIGGMGVCGRKLCCSSFLREFEPVITQLAKDQNLALNPTKLSGCCGRLMCCLRYEADMYIESQNRFPSIGTKIKTDKGLGDLIKFDIFKDVCTLRYENGETQVLTLEETESFIKAAKEREKNSHRKSGKNRFNRRNKPKNRKPRDTKPNEN